MYLYVEKAKGMERVPQELLTMFGKAELAMTLLLTPEKPLARADATKVINSIQADGYYLQLPPPESEYMQEINRHNSKLGT